MNFVMSEVVTVRDKLRLPEEAEETALCEQLRKQCQAFWVRFRLQIRLPSMRQGRLESGRVALCLCG